MSADNPNYFLHLPNENGSLGSINFYNFEYISRILINFYNLINKSGTSTIYIKVYKITPYKNILK